MPPEIPLEQFNSVLEALVEEVLAAAACAAPPVDAFRVANALGLVVARDAPVAQRARLVRLSSPRRVQTSILLVPEPRIERQQWSVAHEIGEHLAIDVCQRLGIHADELRPQGREQIANLLANRILLPGAWFFPDARRAGWDLFALKQTYATASHELIARRMLDATTRVIISVYDHDRCSWRKSNLPGRPRPPGELESHCRERAHATGAVATDENAGCEIQAWPIHEPEWRREIVRVANKYWD